MDKIENMSLVVTDGDLHRAFLEDYGSTECDFEVADAVQQAYMGGALVVVQALWGAATAEEPRCALGQEGAEQDLLDQGLAHVFGELEKQGGLQPKRVEGRTRSPQSAQCEKRHAHRRIGGRPAATGPHAEGFEPAPQAGTLLRRRRT